MDKEYERYPEYKDSGVEWLGEIPSGWEARKLSSFVKLQGGGTPNTNDTSLWEGGIVWVTPKDYTSANSEYLVDSERKISEEGLQTISGLVPAGSVLMTCRAPVGNVAIAGKELATNQGFISCLVSNGISNRYLYYSLKSAKKVMDMNAKGGTFQEISRSKMGAVKLPLPPHGTQNRIVEFLDRETAHIDASVSELESLVSLLTEKRKALISETVTRGLPGEHTEFKDSGVEWLGEIPSGWEITKLGKIAEEIRRPAESGQENITAFRNGRVTLRKNVRSVGYTEADKEHGYQSIHKGDLVIHNMDAFAGAIGVSDSFGKSTPVYSASRVNQAVANTYYVSEIIRQMAYSGWIIALSRGIRERSTDFRWKSASQQVIPLPPLQCQNRIVEFINQKTFEIDKLVTEAKDSISLLKEKRKSLISDSVSGKIKV